MQETSSIKDTYPVQGMHCAGCASTIEKTLRNASGVTEVSVNFATNTVSLIYNESEVSFKKLQKLVDNAGYQLQAKEEKSKVNEERSNDLAKTKRSLFFAIALAIVVVVL